MLRENQKNLLRFLLPVLFVWVLLSVKIHTYSRFISDSPDPQAGILDLQDTVWSQNSRYFLSNGWAFYENRFFTPDDLASLVPAPTRYLAPGDIASQYLSAHSAGTYRLTVLLPPEPRQYALEVPRINGRYQLWINGQCYADTVSPQTIGASLAVLVFEAAKQVDLVIIANDISQSQSGLIHPPVFGCPDVLWSLMVGRLLVGSAACVLALVLAVISFIVALHRPRVGLSRMLLCLCYAGSVSRLPLHMLSMRGDVLRVLTFSCFFGMILAFFLVFGTVCQMPRKWHRAICALALVQCMMVALTSLLPRRSHPPIHTYMCWIRFNFIIAFLALIGFVQWCLRRGRICDKLLFAGSGGIAAALLNMIVYPKYEPIFSQWPLESGVLLLLILIGVSNARYLIGLYMDKLKVQEREQAARRLAGVQHQKYQSLLTHLDHLKHCKHEMRSQLVTLLNLSRAGMPNELERQLLDLLGHTEYGAYCSHNLLNALLNCTFSNEVLSRMVFQTQILGLPEQLPLEDIDLCSLLSNILENAIEGCDRLPEGAEKQISCQILTRSGHLYINCVNTCPDDIVKRSGRFVSSKPEPQLHGYGLRYIEMCVAKYDGLFQANHCGGRFNVDIAIPIE